MSSRSGSSCVVCVTVVIGARPFGLFPASWCHMCRAYGSDTHLLTPLAERGSALRAKHENYTNGFPRTQLRVLREIGVRAAYRTL